jgi:hypothetical protein
MGDIADRIREEVGGWDGVESGSHRFGGIEFRVAGHEIGHLHGDRLADLPFPVRIRRELVKSGQALPHHVLPDTGWVSYRIGSEDDVPGAIALFRLNYERITAAAARAEAPESAESDLSEPAEAASGEAAEAVAEPV